MKLGMVDSAQPVVSSGHVIYGFGMPQGPVRPHDDGALIGVWVVPGAKKPGIAGLHGENLKVRVSEPPEGGKATQAVERLLAGCLNVDVDLVRGMTSRRKLFLASGIDTTTARAKLGV